VGQRLSGTIQLQVDGVSYNVVGSFTYNLGHPMREALVGHDKVHGYKELPKAPFIEGEIRDQPGLDLSALQNVTDATVTLVLAVGKIIVLRDAWYASEGDVATEEANIAVRYEGLSAEEVPL
jgi:hypothetical protein